MINSPEIKEIYRSIQHQLNILIPEKWESIYLYAAVMNQFSSMQAWEMYFYYIPQSILKKNPINVYEIPNKFNVDEKEYLELVDNLCNAIKKLHKEYKSVYGKEWTNMVVSIKDEKFLIEYNYEDLLSLKYTSHDRHIIFKHKYLNIPIQSFSKKEQKVLQDFNENEQYKIVCDRDFEYITKRETRNYIEFEKDYGSNIEDLYSSQLIDVEKKKLGFWNIVVKLVKKLHIRNKKLNVQEEIIEDKIDFQPLIQILNDK